MRRKSLACVRSESCVSCGRSRTALPLTNHTGIRAGSVVTPSPAARASRSEEIRRHFALARAVVAPANDGAARDLRARVQRAARDAYDVLQRRRRSRLPLAVVAPAADFARCGERARVRIAR